MPDFLKEILPLFVPLISIISISTFLAIILKTKINWTFLPTIVLIIVTLFLSGLTNFRGSLLLGYYIILAFSLISLFFSARMYFVDKLRFKRISFSPGIVLFLLFFSFALFLNFERMFSEWDEFSFWGSVVKGMYSLDSLATHNDSTLLIESYVPGIALIQYFFTRPFQTFVEYPSYIALNMLFFSSLIIFVNKINLRNFLLISLGLILPMFGYVNFYSSLYVDTLIGVFLGLTILTSYKYSKPPDLIINIILLSSFGLALSLTKDMGLIFSLLALGIVSIDFLMFRKKEIKNFLLVDKLILKRIKRIIFLLSPFLLTVLFQILWRTHLKSVGIYSTLGTARSSLISILKTRALLPFQVDIIKNFIFALKNQIIYPLNLNFIQIIVYYLVVFSLLILTSTSTYKKDKIRLFTTLLLLVGGNIVYLGILLYSYIFIFGQYEGLKLASYNRYMLSYIIGLLLSIMVFFVVKKKNQKKPPKKNLLKELLIIINVTTLFLLFNFLITNIKPFLSIKILHARTSVNESIEIRKPFEEIKDWSKYITNQKEKTYFISQGDQGFNKLVLMHNTYPSNTEWIGDYSVSTTQYFPENMWTMIISPEDWEDYVLKNYDYLYLFNYDDNFVQLYGNFFEEIKQYQLYKVTELGDSLKLVPLNK